MHSEAIDTTNATPANAAALIERKPLLDALTFLARHIVERGNTIPILSCVLICATDAGVRLAGTDLDIFAETTIPAAWDVPGSFAADSAALLAAVKACDGDTINLAVDGGKLKVWGSGVAVSVTILPACDFPAAKAIEKPARLVFDAATLAADVLRVRGSVSTEETRYYLNGAYFHAPVMAADAPPVLRMVSTDGHRLSVVERPLGAIEGDALPAHIVPRKLLAAMSALFGKKPAGDVALTFDGAACRMIVDCGDWSLRSKTIDGTFPEYGRVIPSQNMKQATFNADALAATAKAMRKAVPAKQTRAVVVSLSSAGASLCMIGPDGSVAAPLAASWIDTAAKGESEVQPSLDIGFNVAYLADLAAAFPAGDLVAHLADAATPVLWTSPAAPEFRMVLMPMRVDDAPASSVKRQPAAPVVERVKSAVDVFSEAYRAAFEARDGAAMKAALGVYTQSADFIRQNEMATFAGRAHSQLAMICARIRSDALRAVDMASFQAKREGLRLRRAVRRDTAICRSREGYRRGSFARLGENMRRADETRAQIAAIEGYLADDARDVLPVMLTDGKRSFVLASDLANVAATGIALRKASGEYARSRRRCAVMRSEIARIIQPREPKAKAAAAPAADSSEIAALRDMVAAMAARIDALETTERVAAVAVEPHAGDDDGRDAYIATLLAERDALRAERDAAIGERDEARQALTVADRAAADVNAERERASNEAARLGEARLRTARRMVALRTAARAGSATTAALDAATAELERLRPVAAAIAAMAGAVAAPAASNVTPLRVAA